MPARDPLTDPLDRAVRRRQFAFGTLFEKRYAASEALPHHEHDRAYVTLVLRGGYTEFRPRGTEHLDPGAGMLHPRGSAHANRFADRSTRLLRVDFDDAWLARRDTRAPGPTVLPPAAAGDLVDRLAVEVLQPAPFRELAIESLLEELLDRSQRVAPVRGARPPWLPAAQDLARDTACDGLGLGGFAARVGVHRSHLARVFRSHVGCTVGEYARRERLRRACAELVEGAEPIAAIAVRHGFCDQAHLTRAMVRLLGTTPARFRKTAQP